jgi:arylsulfatase A-like enzyme
MTQPNIIFILIDDMGWRDLGCYGSDFYETPNLDRLAAEGMRFTDAYASCPVCSPTRASIMSGKYPATVGVTDWIDTGKHIHPARGRLVDVPYLDHLPLAETTVAAALRDGGYQTWHVGKWHLGGGETLPERHGFEINIGGSERGGPGKDGYFNPQSIKGLEAAPEGAYLNDYLTDEAIRLIRERDDRPFFLNFWHYAVHQPIAAPADLVAKYAAKAKALGLDRLDPIQEGEHFPCEHKKHLRVQRRTFQSDAVYAAMIENLDWNTGRLLRAVADAGQAENTIVIFTSDNGGLATSEGSPTCNSPLAEGKGWMYEGGTREPFFVKWPGVTAPGSLCAEPTTSPDLYPTLLELAGLPPRPAQHTDGVSIVPLLRGQPFERGPIFWHYPHYGNQGGTPGSSVRLGDFKLIEFFEDGRLELYNLREDIGETNNLVNDLPDVARDLHARLTAWREQVEAKIPQPNPEYQPVGENA